ncbi:hypothetical protein [Bacillus sp. JJ722]|uniref:hypothetical protein n=1 Tax=Bacillus sp. JJ722 TaxID=3122973 RepID=UPI002FFF7068
MLEPSLKITKIWEDVDFFEIKMKWKGISCSAIIDIYITNESLEEFRNEIIEFSSFTKDEFNTKVVSYPYSNIDFLN